MKELYYYLDSTPTHSYMRMLYKYPQGEFPYAGWSRRTAAAARAEPEFELLDTGVFDGRPLLRRLRRVRQGGPEDMLVRITVANRGPEPAPLHVLPTLWFRNTWSWDGDERRAIELRAAGSRTEAVLLAPPRRPRASYFARLCRRARSCSSPRTKPTRAAVRRAERHAGHVKDAFHDYVVARQSATR